MISRVWFQMADVMLIQGRVENIFDEEDFARMLRDRLGDDAERYFRERCDIDFILRDLTDDQIEGYCSGECDHVQSAIEHWTAILEEVQEELENLSEDMMNQTKAETQKIINQLIQKINAEL